MFTLSLPPADEDGSIPTEPSLGKFGECTFPHQLFGGQLDWPVLTHAQMFIEVVFRMLGPNYEIISAFIQNSDELGVQAAGGQGVQRQCKKEVSTPGCEDR